MFSCIQEASNNTGVPQSTIAYAARERRARKGFIWSYTDTININDFYIKKTNKYYLYNESKVLLGIYNSRKELLDKYPIDKSNLSRAAKTGIKISGYYISYSKIY